MGNTTIARLTPDRRGPWTVESPYPQRQEDRVQHGIEERLTNSSGGGGGSSIDMWEAPMPQHQPWSDFTAAKLVPDSVYLWACDEPQPGGSRPSRSDAWVAWVILITQMICYLQLIVVSSGDDPPTSSSTSEVTSTTNAGSYTVFSVAAAMYLMTSIAAADLGAGIALISEARMDMAAKRWVQRKMFGLMLLVSFALLAAASIRVLFKTSSEDVELVVGAATVLFIADVDEKVMVVLKAVPSKWRLFWVLELIGLSAALALLGLRATGHWEDVIKNDDAGCTSDNANWVEGACNIYSWYFIFFYNPVTVTLFSLLVNTFVASPKAFLKKHVFGNGSRQDWLFLVVFAFWILTPLSLLFGGNWVSTVMFYIILLIQVIGGACWLFLVCKRLVCFHGSDQLISLAGYMNFRWTPSTKFGMICVPVCLFLVRIVLDILTIELSLDSDEDWVVPDAFHSAFFHMWLVWCMYREGGGCPESPEMPSSPEAADIVVTEPVMIAGSQGQGSVTEPHQERGSRRSTRNLLLGWFQANTLIFVYSLFYNILFSEYRWLFLPLSATYWFAWTLVGICAAASSTKGVAFWSLATYVLYIVFYSIWIWISNGDSVNIFDFDWP